MSRRMRPRSSVVPHSDVAGGAARRAVVGDPQLERRAPLTAVRVEGRRQARVADADAPVVTGVEDRGADRLAAVVDRAGHGDRRHRQRGVAEPRADGARAADARPVRVAPGPSALAEPVDRQALARPPRPSRARSRGCSNPSMPPARATASSLVQRAGRAACLELQVQARVLPGERQAPAAQRLEGLDVDAGGLDVLPGRRVLDRHAALGRDRGDVRAVEQDDEPARRRSARRARAAPFRTRRRARRRTRASRRP